MNERTAHSARGHLPMPARRRRPEHQENRSRLGPTAHAGMSKLKTSHKTKPRRKIDGVCQRSGAAKSLRPFAFPPVSYADACCSPSAGGGSATGSAEASTGSEETTGCSRSGVTSTAGLGVGSGVGSALGAV